MTKKKCLSIYHDNILRRGFVKLVSTDGEAEIPSKIGDVIRLKDRLVGSRDFVFLRANQRRLSMHTCQCWRARVQASETALRTRTALDLS